MGLKDRGVPTQRTPGQPHSRPWYPAYEGMKATANSVRSCVAPAVCRA